MIRTNFLAYPIILKDNVKFSRKEFQIYLEKNNIQTRPIFTGNLLRHPAFHSLINNKNKLNGFKNSDYIMKYGLLIGCHQGLSVTNSFYCTKFNKLKNVSFSPSNKIFSIKEAIQLSKKRGAISFMVDSFSRTKKIKYTCVAHEQAAAMMADSYSRIGPNLSCTMVTSGPGATNLITGIACSWFDSIPSLHITGQVNSYEKQGAQKGTKNTRQVGFQETDIVSITKPITKFSYQLKSPNEIKYILEKATFLAQTGRPGPVVIDIPMDFQKAEINPNKLKSFNVPKIKNNKKLLKININRIITLLKKSNRPVVILGGGIKISKSQKLIEKTIASFNIPFVTTWSGVDLIDHNNRKYIGNVGVYGSRSANFAVQNSDLLISLGSRLDTRITGGVPSSFARGAKVVAIDIDKDELSKQRGLKLFLKIKIFGFFK